MEFGALKLARCRHGWMLCTGPYIGKSLEVYGEYSEGEVAAMGRYLHPGDTLIDVGANIGALTVPLAGLVGAQGRVYAIESHAATFNTLCANLALNAVAQVKPINAFVSSEASPQTSGPWGSYVSDLWAPQIMALDDLALERCVLIKIDVDGGELGVLRSAARLIESTRPVLYFENDVRSASKALLEYAFSLNYDLYWDPQPLFSPDNFRGHPENLWDPIIVFSRMILGLPGEKGLPAPDVPVVEDPEQWWWF